MKQILNNFFSTLRRYKVSSVLNIVGLGVAFAAIYLIAVQLKHDFTYNRQIKDYDRICRLEMKQEGTAAGYAAIISRGYGEAILENNPQVEAYTLVQNHWDVYTKVVDGEYISMNINNMGVLNGIFDILDFEMVDGDLAEFSDSNNIYVSQSIANRFNLKIGDILYDGYVVNVEEGRVVAGIYKDFPKASSFSRFQMIYNYSDRYKGNITNSSYIFYCKMVEGADINTSSSYYTDALIELIKPNTADYDAQELEKAASTNLPRFNPLKDLYFTPLKTFNTSDGSSEAISYVLVFVGLLIVVIAIVNFINFFFALVPVRIKSVNTHKLFGCKRVTLIGNFIIETQGIMLCAQVLAVAIISILQTSIVAEHISASLSIGDNIDVLAVIIVLVVIIATLVALYPAYYITSFPITMVTKSGFGSSKSGKALRYSLIGLQFTISISLIICVAFVQWQHHYMMNYDMGYSTDNIYSQSLPTELTNISTRQIFTSKLKEDSNIIDVAYGQGSLVTDYRMSWGRNLNDEHIDITVYPVSNNFLQFLGIDIIEGRDFLPSDEYSEGGVMIFNQTAKKLYNVELNDKISGHSNKLTTIAGVCKDFNYKSLYTPLEPFVYYVYGKNPWTMPDRLYIRVREGADIVAVSNYIKSCIKELAPTTSVNMFELIAFSDEININYKDIDKQGALISLFAIVSIIITLMGVYGLVLFETQFRQREIVIRRVNGAHIKDILWMVNRQFLYIILVCFAISAPLSYYLILGWFEQFAYRVAISPLVFIATLVGVSIVVLSIVTYRSYGAANQNPAELIGKNN